MTTDAKIKECIPSDYKALPLDEAARLAHQNLLLNPFDSEAGACLRFIAMGRPGLITDAMAQEYTARLTPDSGEIIAVCQILGLTMKTAATPLLRGIAEASHDWMVADAAKDALDVIEGRKQIGYGNTGATSVFTVFKE